MSEKDNEKSDGIVVPLHALCNVKCNNGFSAFPRESS